MTAILFLPACVKKVFDKCIINHIIIFVKRQIIISLDDRSHSKCMVTVQTAPAVKSKLRFKGGMPVQSTDALLYRNCQLQREECNSTICKKFGQ